MCTSPAIGQLTLDSAPAVRQPGLPPGTGPAAIIWPETAVPAFLNTHMALQHWLDSMVPEGGSLVVGGTGSCRIEAVQLGIRLRRTRHGGGAL